MTRGRASPETYRDYFSQKISKHGDRLAALDYGSAESQRRKFDVMIGGIRPATRPLSFLDLGCGFGDFLPYLRRRRVPIRSYLGIDLVPDAVAIAQRKHPEGRFRVRDILHEGLPGRYDYAVANGIFYVRAPDSEAHMERTVEALWDHCRIGVLFNARSRHADPEYVRRETHLYHYDPVKVLRFCTTMSRAVVLRHDYLPHEFTVYMYREVA